MLLLGNGTVMTRWEEQPMLRDGCVAMEDGVICALGTTEELTAMLRQAGFSQIRIFGELKMRPPVDGEQRVFFTARKDK